MIGWSRNVDFFVPSRPCRKEQVRAAEEMFAPLVTGGQQPLGNEREGRHEATTVMFTRNLCARLRTIGDGQQPRTSVASARASCRADTNCRCCGRDVGDFRDVFDGLGKSTLQPHNQRFDYSQA